MFVGVPENCYLDPDILLTRASYIIVIVFSIVTLYNVVKVHIFLYRFLQEKRANLGGIGLYDVKKKKKKMGNDQSSAPKEDGEVVPSQVLEHYAGLTKRSIC